MIPPAESLLKYDNPVSITKSTDGKSRKVSGPSELDQRYLAKVPSGGGLK